MHKPFARLSRSFDRLAAAHPGRAFWNFGKFSTSGRLGLSLAMLLISATPVQAQDGDADALNKQGGTSASREWRFQTDYLWGRESNRPIDIVATTASHVWHLPYGTQGSLGIGVLNATGDRIEPNRPPINSNATGLLLGGGIRFEPVRIGPVAPFVEGSVHFLYTAGHPFPAEGTSVNGFVRWGGGVDIRLSRRVSVEAGYHGSHVSNGGGLVPYNPAWNGRGAFIGLNIRAGKN